MSVSIKVVNNFVADIDLLSLEMLMQDCSTNDDQIQIHVHDKNRENHVSWIGCKQYLLQRLIC